MRLVLSGGGTGGHIIPNVALIEELRKCYSPDSDNNSASNTASAAANQNLEILYIGSYKGMEKKLMENLGVPYYPILSGKMRRYFSLKNFGDFFKIPIGILQAFLKLWRFKPQAIFCKGGYVCFPVAVAGKLLGIPVFVHESDVSPGLANRLAARFAHTICISFEESRKYFRHHKVVLTGTPVRRELTFGNKEDGLRFADFDDKKPILLFMGGSLGATFINDMVWNNLDFLLSHYQVAHICGEGHVKNADELLKYLSEPHQKYLKNYRAFTFVNKELKDLYAAADVIIARAGAITLAEIDFFDKPAILIPLSKMASRGDQIENAAVFAQHHLSSVILQEDFTPQKFLEELKRLLTESGRANNKTGIDFVTRREKKFAPLEKIIHLLEKA